MIEQINQRELRNDSGRIMRGLAEGRSYVISRHGQPIGELRPMRRQRWVERRTAVSAFREAPALDRDRFRSDLDTVADQGIEPRA